MQLEVGKYYKTRNGQKVGPMFETDGWHSDNMEWNDGSGKGWTKKGTVYNNIEDENDLIKEWKDDKPSIKLSNETIDNIAIDSLKFHFDHENEPLRQEAFRIVLRFYGVTV